MLLCGCSCASAAPGSSAAQSQSPSADSEISFPVEYLPDIPGGGSIKGDYSEQMTAGQVKAVTDFMDIYYQSLGTLQVRDCGSLFASRSQASAHMRAWNALVTIRSNALVDLSLTDYDYELEFDGLQELENGMTGYVFYENTTLHFSATKDTDSMIMNMFHIFSLTGSEETGWKIDFHFSRDSSYFSYMFDYDDGSIETALSNIELRHSQTAGDEYEASWENDYDRDAAVEYARRWVGERNDDWPVYDDAGGNCMNFVSQAINAGGVEMDNESPSWYWYGSGNRTGSWSSVNSFYDYAVENRGEGMVCQADAYYYSGSPGDVILMGVSGYRHIVMISEIIPDSEGNTADYLICSNTGNYRDYPVGAYFYTYQTLVRILGWND